MNITVPCSCVHNFHTLRQSQAFTEVKSYRNIKEAFHKHLKVHKSPSVLLCKSFEICNPLFYQEKTAIVLVKCTSTFLSVWSSEATHKDVMKSLETFRLVHSGVYLDSSDKLLHYYVTKIPKNKDRKVKIPSIISTAS